MSWALASGSVDMIELFFAFAVPEAADPAGSPQIITTLDGLCLSATKSPEATLPQVG